MLERLRLQNFQRHEDFRLVLDDRVTTIVGTSDVGKSSILRALRWLMAGKPLGSSFVRHGQDEATVALWLDGRKLSRRKGRKTNKMTLDGTELEAFGSELPESVNLLCNVDETNFQTQHESPFWLSLTAGQASRELNAVVDLEVIDSTLSIVAAEARRSKMAVELTQERVQQCEGQLVQLDWVEGMSRDWQQLEKLQKRQDESEASVVRAKALLGEVEELREQAAMEVPDTMELDEEIAELDEVKKCLAMLKTLVEGIGSWHKQIAEMGKQIGELRAVLAEQSGGICPLCGGVLKC